MALSDGDIAFAVDLFAELGAVTKRKMFGGVCLYQDGIVFALQAKDGRIYLKTKDPAAIFGVKTDQFHNMPYYAIPEDILDDPQAACETAKTALMAL
jgi:DNA transformation protein